MEEEKLKITNLYSGKVIATNTLFNLAGQVLLLFVAIVTIPLIIKGLGTDRFGILTLAWLIIGYFSLFDLGLGRALTQIIAARLGEEDVKELPGLVWTALTIMIVMGVIGSIIAWSLSPLLISKILKMPVELRLESLHSFYILSASIPVVILSSGFVGILTAYQRFDLINIVRIPLGLANLVIPVVMLFISTNLVSITLWLAISRIIACFAQYWFCLLVMPSLRKEKHFIAGSINQLFSFGGWMTISNIVGPIMAYLDRFVIGVVISVTAVAYYATPYEIITKLWIVSGALISSLFPAFAASNNSDNSETVKLLSKSIAASFIMIFPIVLVIVTFSKEGLMIWLGEDFANNSAPVLQWLAAGVFVNCLASIFFALIQGRGRPDLTAKLHLLELILYLPLLWWALKRYGIVGAAVAWTLRVTIDGILLLWVTQALIPLTRKLTLKLSGCVIFASIILAISVFTDSLILRSLWLFVTLSVFTTFSLWYLNRNRILWKISSRM